MAVYQVELYSFANTSPMYTVTFTDKAEAEHFARHIYNDEGLLGIDDVRLKHIVSDEVAVAKFWRDVAEDAEVVG